MLLLLYVDDMLLTCNNNTLIQKLLSCLNANFSLKYIGLLHYFLGIQTHFHKDGLFMSQKKYTTDILVNASMAYYVPMPTTLPLQCLLYGLI